MGQFQRSQINGNDRLPNQSLRNRTVSPQKKVSESDPHRACQKYIPLHSEILEIKVKKMIEELGSEDYIVK